jgi:hypothetical protein
MVFDTLMSIMSKIAIFYTLMAKTSVKILSKITFLFGNPKGGPLFRNQI